MMMMFLGVVFFSMFFPGSWRVFYDLLAVFSCGLARWVGMADLEV